MFKLLAGKIDLPAKCDEFYSKMFARNILYINHVGKMPCNVWLMHVTGKF